MALKILNTKKIQDKVIDSTNVANDESDQRWAQNKTALWT